MKKAILKIALGTVLSFSGICLAGYYGGGLKNHGHTSAAGDGGPLLNPVITGTATVKGIVVSTVNVSGYITVTGTQTSTINNLTVSTLTVNGASITATSAGVITISTISVSSGTVGQLTVTAGILSNQIQFYGTGGIVGVIDGSNALTGNVGVYVSSSVSQTNARILGGSGTYTDIASFGTVPAAGDYDIAATYCLTANGATVTYDEILISTTSGNTSSGTIFGDTNINGPLPTASVDSCGIYAAIRMSLNGSQNVNLKMKANYSVATPKGYGRLSMRRIR